MVVGRSVNEDWESFTARMIKSYKTTLQKFNRSNAFNM